MPSTTRAAATPRPSPRRLDRNDQNVGPRATENAPRRAVAKAQVDAFEAFDRLRPNGVGLRPSGGAKKGSFTTVNLNIKNNPPLPQAKLMHDVRKAAKGADLIGWNEISVPSYRAGIRALGKDWGHYMPNPEVIQTPISWKKSTFKKLDEGFIRTHRGLPGVSPNRYVTWVKLKHRETGETIVRMNTHTVAGAWSPKKQAHREWRRDSWNSHIQQLRQLIKKFEDKGENVIIGGDFNRNHYPVLGKLVKYDNSLNVGTHGHATLDYVMHVPDKSIKTVRGGVRTGFHSDHDAVVVKYRLTGK